MAYLLEIAFQYFTIAPIRGLSGFPGIWAAIKADTLSLTAFEVGLFACMWGMHQSFTPELKPNQPALLDDLEPLLTAAVRAAGTLGPAIAVAVPGPARETSRGSVSSAGTILVVDDESTNTRILTALLAPEYTVTVAASGEEALAAVARAKPDLILLLIDRMVAFSDGRLATTPQYSLRVFTRWAPGTRQLRNIVKCTDLSHLAKR
jgi:hypothetical protein